MILRIVISGVYVDNLLIQKTLTRSTLQFGTDERDLLLFVHHLSLL